MADKVTSRQMKSLITRTFNAAREDAFAGSMHPDDREQVRALYNRLRARLEGYVGVLIRNQKD